MKNRLHLIIINSLKPHAEVSSHELSFAHKMSLQTLLIVYTKVSFHHYLNGFLLFDQDLDVRA